MVLAWDPKPVPELILKKNSHCCVFEGPAGNCPLFLGYSSQEWFTVIETTTMENIDVNCDHGDILLSLRNRILEQESILMTAQVYAQKVSAPSSPELSSQCSSDGPQVPTVNALPEKRRVKKACLNCRNIKLACDHHRPCTRCVKSGAESKCIDVPRKSKVVKQRNKREWYPTTPNINNIAATTTTTIGQSASEAACNVVPHLHLKQPMAAKSTALFSSIIKSSNVNASVPKTRVNPYILFHNPTTNFQLFNYHPSST
eukprot:gene2090-2380_t